MELVKIRIKKQFVSAQYGPLSEGHILSTDAAFAKFVIDEMKAGEYIDAPAPAKKAEKSTEATTEKKVGKHG